MLSSAIPVPESPLPNRSETPYCLTVCSFFFRPVRLQLQCGSRTCGHSRRRRETPTSAGQCPKVGETVKHGGIFRQHLFYNVEVICKPKHRANRSDLNQPTEILRNRRHGCHTLGTTAPSSSIYQSINQSPPSGCLSCNSRPDCALSRNQPVHDLFKPFTT